MYVRMTMPGTASGSDTLIITPQAAMATAWDIVSNAYNQMCIHASMIVRAHDAVMHSSDHNGRQAQPDADA